jgi:hypothetical protein
MVLFLFDSVALPFLESRLCVFFIFILKNYYFASLSVSTPVTSLGPFHYHITTVVLATSSYHVPPAKQARQLPQPPCCGCPFRQADDCFV